LNILKFKAETHSEEETHQAAAAFTATLKTGTAVALTGELGAGKTTFAKGIIKALHLTSVWFQGSPTFTLIQEYRQAEPHVFHFDFYRIRHPEEIYDLGWDEYCMEQGIIIVEWADKFAGVMPAGTRWLKLENTGRMERRIEEIVNS
jgi:tRNA threonylcarbamoyladenosine biosynthesis protein TsaE